MALIKRGIKSKSGGKKGSGRAYEISIAGAGGKKNREENSADDINPIIIK